MAQALFDRSNGLVNPVALSETPLCELQSSLNLPKNRR